MPFAADGWCVSMGSHTLFSPLHALNVLAHRHTHLMTRVAQYYIFQTAHYVDVWLYWSSDWHRGAIPSSPHFLTYNWLRHNAGNPSTWMTLLHKIALHLSLSHSLPPLPAPLPPHHTSPHRSSTGIHRRSCVWRTSTLSSSVTSTWPSWNTMAICFAVSCLAARARPTTTARTYGSFVMFRQS